ncbi:MAG: tetraacyldisaccharide 4'-kinase [Gammaproteobacteria bacterium]|jgi:tetraacyldisaccharide 4'-kinase
MKSLDHYWYSQNPIAWALLPLSWLFCAVALIRRYGYINSWLESHAVRVPVVVVGNLTVGGSGKTPLIIGLCQYLIQQGFKPGIVSRGYGAAISGEYAVSIDDRAAVCGDEPLLIKQRTGRPVIIGRDRVAAANKLLVENDCDVILSDDGMQHYRLRRDIEIAVIDVERPFGNGFCLPAGPLREPEARLGSVDMVVHHGISQDEYHFTLEFEDAVNLATGEKRTIDSFTATSVHAVAGIGHPQRFFSQLRRQGLDVDGRAFPDHHVFRAADIEFRDGLPVLMTEKDAVKCAGLQPGSGPGGVLEHCWSVPVNAILSKRLGPDLMDLIKQCQ